MGLKLLLQQPDLLGRQAWPSGDVGFLGLVGASSTDVGRPHADGGRGGGGGGGLDGLVPPGGRLIVYEVHAGDSIRDVADADGPR